MIWEQTDRVRAETANDSSSESAWGDRKQSGLLSGEEVEPGSWMGSGGQQAEVMDEANIASGMALSPLGDGGGAVHTVPVW